MAKVVPNKGVVDYAVGAMKKMVEQIGRSQQEEKGQVEQKARHKEADSGVKKGIDEWEQMAKRIQEGAETRAQKNSSTGTGMDADMVDMTNALKEDQARNTWGEYHDENGGDESKLYDAT